MKTSDPNYQKLLKNVSDEIRGITREIYDTLHRIERRCIFREIDADTSLVEFANLMDWKEELNKIAQYASESFHCMLDCEDMTREIFRDDATEAEEIKKSIAKLVKQFQKQTRRTV
jgi:hypothetical protein